jgi:hypothetical protein
MSATTIPVNHHDHTSAALGGGGIWFSEQQGYRA